MVDTVWGSLRDSPIQREEILYISLVYGHTPLHVLNGAGVAAPAFESVYF
jgi:hypothetical protein